MTPPPDVVARASELAARASKPARVDNVLLAIAGFADRGLIQSGLFYPASVKSPEARLRYYAEHFRLVEIDATYYALLSPDVVAHWVEWTPPDFRFDVKAHPLFTGHPIQVARLPRDLRDALERGGAGARVYPDAVPEEIAREIERRFFASIAPLVNAGRLGAVFLQFPPWFTATAEHSRHVERIVERFPEVPFAVEFRHGSWLLPERREKVFDLLRRLDLPYVGVDEPAARIGGVPPVVEATSRRLAVVRFHGHNVAGWNRRGASVVERLDYLYDPSELEPWVSRVRELSEQSQSVHAVFNNCVRNYAVINAKDLAVLLTEDRRGAGEPPSAG